MVSRTSREPKKEARRFINDTVRNDFHRRFLHKYIKYVLGTRSGGGKRGRRFGLVWRVGVVGRRGYLALNDMIATSSPPPVRPRLYQQRQEGGRARAVAARTAPHRERGSCRTRASAPPRRAAPRPRCTRCSRRRRAAFGLLRASPAPPRAAVRSPRASACGAARTTSRLGHTPSACPGCRRRRRAARAGSRW